MSLTWPIYSINSTELSLIGDTRAAFRNTSMTMCMKAPHNIEVRVNSCKTRLEILKHDFHPTSDDFETFFQTKFFMLSLQPRSVLCQLWAYVACIFGVRHSIWIFRWLICQSADTQIKRRLAGAFINHGFTAFNPTLKTSVRPSMLGSVRVLTLQDFRWFWSILTKLN